MAKKSENPAEKGIKVASEKATTAKIAKSEENKSNAPKLSKNAENHVIPKEESFESIAENKELSPAKSSNKKKDSFKVTQYVVYPLQGVGQITEKTYRNFKGQQVEYYTIYIAATAMTVMLPVKEVNELGLRSIVPKADAEQALESMSDKNEPLTSDWKLRYQNNLNLLKEGGVMDIATVVRSLYHRSKVKELPILERKLYDNALKLMIDEVSLALSRKKEEIEDLLHTRLENSNN